MLATAGFVLGHLAALIGIVLCCASAGWLALRRMTFRSATEAFAFRAATGFGIIGTLLFLIGLAGWLTRPVIAAITVTLLAVAVVAFGREWSERGGWARGILGLLALVPSFALSLYPPTAFDATLYHLPYARLFADSSAVVFAHTLRFPVFPQLNHMLFMAAFVLYDDVTAHLVQLVAFGVTAAAVISWAGSYGGRRTSLYAFALWAGSPLAVYLAGTGYIDLGVAMFVTLAVLALDRWKDGGQLSWLCLGGVLAGMAASSKYHGILIIGLMSIAVVFLARGRRARSTLMFIFAALLVASPFYLRNEIVTGNPFFPYLDEVFGGLEWNTRGDERMLGSGDDALGTAETVLRKTIASPRFVVFPWRVAFDQRALGGLPPISLWMPLIIPGAVIAAFRWPKLLPGVLVALGYAAAVASLDPRFLIIVFPLFLVPAAVIAGRVIRTRWIAAVLLAILFAPGPAYGLYRIVTQGPLPVTGEERRDYLSSQIGVYPAIDTLNQRCGERYGVYALHQENAAYYAEGRFFGDHLGPARYRLIEPLLNDPVALERVLRRLPVDYLLVDSGLASRLNSTPDFAARFRHLFRSGGFDVFLVPGGNECAGKRNGGLE